MRAYFEVIQGRENRIIPRIAADLSPDFQDLSEREDIVSRSADQEWLRDNLMTRAPTLGF
jgi:hypothetical protein